MLRVLFVLSPVFVVLASGCVSQSAHRAQLAEIQEEHLVALQDLNAQLAAATSKVSTAGRQSAALQSKMASTQKDIGLMAAQANKLAAELANLKEKYAGIDVSLVNELKGVPGVVLDKKGAIQVSGLSFETGGAKLKDESSETIRKVAEALAARKGLIYVDGHTDSVPVKNPATVKLFSDNLGLSMARAAAVARVLIGAKVPANRLVVRGFGSTQPVAKNDSAANRAKNRRVEIRLVPSDR
jgi:flagellar motor protein MotB